MALNLLQEDSVDLRFRFARHYTFDTASIQRAENMYLYKILTRFPDKYCWELRRIRGGADPRFKLCGRQHRSVFPGGAVTWRQWVCSPQSPLLAKQYRVFLKNGSSLGNRDILQYHRTVPFARPPPAAEDNAANRMCSLYCGNIIESAIPRSKSILP